MMDYKAKILLLRLPQNLNDVYDHAGILHPYSLAIISSFLKQNQKSVTLFDAAINHLGREKIIEYVKDLNPRVLGVSIMTQHLPQRFIQNNM